MRPPDRSAAPARALTSAIAMAACSAPAAAQQAIYTAAATQPSPGHFALRQTFSYSRFSSDPTPLDRTVDDFTLTTDVTYGLAPDTSLNFRFPLVYRDTEFAAAGSDDSEFSVGDMTLLIRQRIVREDTGPIDTIRFTLYGGLEIPSYGAVSSESWDPIAGGVLTIIRGRHGFNVEGSYKLTTGGESNPVRAGDGTADLFRGNASYLFRVSPAEYGAETTAAWYAVMELNSVLETNGDFEVFLSPGVLYEATTFALEAGLQIPVARSLDERPEEDIAVTIGIRFLF